MIVINRAILHILDFNSGLTVFSGQELLVENSVKTFLLNHITKAYQDQALKIGHFYEDSIFKDKLFLYISGKDCSFIDFSRWIAERMYDSIAKSEKLDSADLIVTDIQIEGQRLIAVFKCNNKIGFIHQVTQEENGVRNEIINHYAILPGLSQKIDECAFINPTTEEIRFLDRKYKVDGSVVQILPENILECTYTASPKSTLEEMTTMAQKIAEKHGQNTMEAVIAAKTLIAEKVQQSVSIEPAQLGKELFKASPIMQEEYFSEAQSAGLADTVKIEADFALKKTKMHKIKTDTGIELSIPLDYFQGTEYVEFVNNTNGTLSINLKNISNLTSK